MPRRSLLWRVFSSNAIVLIAAVMGLAVLPVTVSWPVSSDELIVLTGGLAVVLLLSLAMFRRILTPLARLRQAMRTIEPLAPRERIDVGARSVEVAELAEAFNDMLDRLAEERRQSSHRAQSAQEQERRALSLELHDQIGQNLTALLLQLDVAARSAEAPAQRSALEASIATVRECLNQVRGIVRRLRPEVLDELGLVSALEHLCGRAAADTGLTIECSCDPGLPRLSADAQLALYRVAQESLTNVARHSGARAASVALERHESGVRLTVADDGVGPPADDNEGWGVRGMRERALMIGAALEVRRRVPRGTEVVLELPHEETRP